MDSITDLMSTRDIWQRLETTRRTVQRWRSAEHFPNPVEVDQFGGHYFRWSDVRLWAVRTGRWDDVVDMPIRKYHASQERIRRAG